MNLIAFSLAAALAIAIPVRSAPDYSASFVAGDFDAALSAARAAIAAGASNAQARLTAGTIELYRNELKAALRDLGAVPLGSEAGSRARRLLAEIRRREHLARHADTTFGGARDVVPFLRTDPLPTVAVRVNGAPGVFQIDTGAPGLTVDSSFARRLHLPAARGTRVGIFAGGPRRLVPQAEVATFALGATTIRHLSADVLPIGSMAKSGAPAIDGVIGTGIFERFSGFTLDYAGGRLVLYAPGAGVPAEAETRVPLLLVGDHFLVTRGSIAGIEGPVLVDTGLIGGGVAPSTEVVRRAHLAQRNGGTGVVPSGARIPLRRVVVPSVRIGASIEYDLAGFYAPGPSPLDMFPFTVNGAVSHDFFRERVLTIDFAAMRLSISKGRARS